MGRQPETTDSRGTMIEPIQIDPDAWFDDESLKMAFGITDSAIATGRRAGTLRSTRKGLRTFYKGEWVNAWLEADEPSSAALDLAEPATTRKP